jgi:hypothetical protein
MSDLQVYQPPQVPQAPQLPARLRQQVARILAGPTRYPGVPGSDDPGLRLRPPVPTYDPDAERIAAELRAMLERPADRQMMHDWLELLAASVNNPPASEREFSLRLAAVVMACGDLPAVCWGQDTLQAAVRTSKFWPSVAEIYALLKRRADQLQAELAAVEQIARANDYGPTVVPGNGESTAPYDPGPASPAHAPHPSMPKRDPDAQPIRVDEAEKARVLAAFGIKPGEPDLLAARRAVFEPKPPAEEPQPEPPEFGGPRLMVVK